MIEREVRASTAYQNGERKLATDVLREFMNTFRDLAVAAHKAGDAVAFARYAARAADCAVSLAPFESPRLAAVAVAAPAPRGETVTRFRLRIFPASFEHDEAHFPTTATH